MEPFGPEVPADSVQSEVESIFLFLPDTGLCDAGSAVDASEDSWGELFEEL